jgi:hypothetical protein
MAKSAGKKMVEAAARKGKIAFTPLFGDVGPAIAATTPKRSKTESLSPAGHVSLRWTDDTVPGTGWISTTTPKGERVPARIRLSSRNSDGSYSYFCYRDADGIAIAKSLDEAKRKCEIGKQPKLSDNVLRYVEDHPLDIPWWLKLTDKERAAIRAQYPYAAPPASRVDRVLSSIVKKGRNGGPDLSDPGTQKLLAEMAAKEAAGATAAATGRVAAKPRTTALETAEGRLVRLKEGNPKKPGTWAHKRWEALFAACDKPASAYRLAGGNLETLANAISKGYVKIEVGGEEPTKQKPKKGGK